MELKKLPVVLLANYLKKQMQHTGGDLFAAEGLLLPCRGGVSLITWDLGEKVKPHGIPGSIWHS
jgi:hypothetical protein